MDSYTHELGHQEHARRPSRVRLSEGIMLLTRKHSSEKSNFPSLSRLQQPPLTPKLEVTKEANAEDVKALLDDLKQSIETHVTQFYHYKEDVEINQYAIEHATTGMSISWLNMVKLLSDQTTRAGAIELCIAWTLLSRCLLLRLGVSNNPGSTFLPPEIVECFQSMSGLLASGISASQSNPERHFTSLSQWKQLTASLLYNTYERDAFTLFDSRTANIERAVEDLNPLLRQFAAPEHTISVQRVEELRSIARKAAHLAFTLFSQPCFWSFDWQTGSFDKPHERVVIFPALLRIMDGQGKNVFPPQVVREKDFLGSYPYY